MSSLQNENGQETYVNPVYQKSFPDPFVLKFDGEYFAYSTGFAEDGNVFGVLRSKDLVHWTEAGGAMKPLDPSPPYYWAPEVTHDNGKFYLYYSIGNETLMEIRVAVSDRPDAGFVDSGNRLTDEDFAIDAHVFIDDDGSKFLFYATDFLEHSHIGTGTVVDRMVNWFTLEGEPKPVTRAKFDWQVYDPNRKEKSGVRWHTVEGPAVMKRKKLYYEMFSGGNWQNTSYGVSFAISSTIENSDEWSQFSDGTNILPILRTLPGTVIGPGHNCIVRGLNNRELYCVYHRWIGDNRVMAIDRMDFAGERIFITGASFLSQPAPLKPAIRDFDMALLHGRKSGDWSIEGGSARSSSDGRSELELLGLPSSFLCELTFQCFRPMSEQGNIAVDLLSGQQTVHITLDTSSNVIRIDDPEDHSRAPSTSALPNDFDWTAQHLLRIEADHCRLSIKLDGVSMPKLDGLSVPVYSLSIVSEKQSVKITSFELTEGFEELFEASDPLEENGWTVVTDDAYKVERGEILMDSAGSFHMQKHRPLSDCEFAANFRALATAERGEFGLVFHHAGNELLRFSLDCGDKRMKVNGNALDAFPAEIVLSSYHQLRVIKTGGQAHCYFDGILAGQVFVGADPTNAAIFGDGVQLGVEMIRLTAI